MKYKITKNRLKKIMIISSLILSTHAVYAKSTDYSLINMCTKSQNILKENILVSMDVTYSNSEEKLSSTKESLSKQLKKLKGEKLSKKMHKKASSLLSSWDKIKGKISDKTTKDGASKLYSEVDSFDKKCQSLIKDIKSKKVNERKKLVATLNLKVQTLTALYIVRSWDAIDEKSYKSKSKILLDSYDKVYKKLDGKIDKEDLVKINKEFTALKFVTTSNSGRFMPVLATKNASRIDDITTQILEGK